MELIKRPDPKQEVDLLICDRGCWTIIKEGQQLICNECGTIYEKPKVKVLK